MVYEGKEYRKLRIFLDYIMIVGTISVIFLEFNAIWIMLPAIIGYLYLIDYDAIPKPKIVWRWNKQAKRFISYEIDKKTGKYIKKVKGD